VKPVVEAGTRDFRRDIVGQTDEQNIKAVSNEVAIVRVKSDSVVNRPGAGEFAVAYGNGS